MKDPPLLSCYFYLRGFGVSFVFKLLALCYGFDNSWSVLIQVAAASPIEFDVEGGLNIS